jgi:hypothetical protein
MLVVHLIVLFLRALIILIRVAVVLVNLADLLEFFTLQGRSSGLLSQAAPWVVLLEVALLRFSVLYPAVSLLSLLVLFRLKWLLLGISLVRV